MLDKNTNKYLTIILVLVILVPFVYKFVIMNEFLDLFCPVGTMKYDPKTCGDGKGKFCCNSKANKDDTSNILLDKIDIATGAYTKGVKWRRYLIISFISVLF